MNPSYQRLIDRLGPQVHQIWCELCDEAGSMQFRSRELYPIIQRVANVSRKTAVDYGTACLAYWLEPGNSDLIRIRSGLYGWESRDDPNTLEM